VLKVAVNMILRKTAPVLAFISARRVDGGTGAINVLLSKKGTDLFLQQK
jgi:DNA-nicking Smr family endonuclease